ncbi:glycoside hydrolase family 65 protein [Helcobacillus massiliensis]|uniref:glycoside hydrolase family 65 protein n=1 Tax=Helcobacillus massiliensis TaxID=521392 RepID=UPI00255674EC|nr:glycosyl hydrolase family 65 protein [Helcobacillus massiliensis]MDK7743151.1 glycosyl hydrolase family 65 protein [Helcobacillus massiliensis]WOO93233.1 glycosyl hydrolase family 65 protein [Helcobacillus massiliensis]
MTPRPHDTTHAHRRDPMDRQQFPVDPWRLVESRPGGDLGVTETIFASANGYLGMRATPEEGRDATEHGTFLNGFHETWDIHHAESAYGFATAGQTIVGVPDSTVIKLYVDDEPLVLSKADILDYERSLDFREGVLRRSVRWRTPAGKHVRVTSTRMVSFTDRHLALMTYEVEMVKGTAPILISSQVLNREDLDREAGGTTDQGSADPRKAAKFNHRVLLSEHTQERDGRIHLGYRTAHSGIGVSVACDHEVATADGVDVDLATDVSEDLGRTVFRAELAEGQRLAVTKSVAYHYGSHAPGRELADRTGRTLDRVRKYGFAQYHQWQAEFLEDFWSRSDVRVEGAEHIQQAIRWCIYQLAQAAARADGRGIPAKGVTGSGYEGHYFWDTDIYVVPFLSFTSPEWARNALRFRYGLLESARRRATVLNQRGALFPWRTITGEEASAYYAAGTAQYHIDADIAWAFNTYTTVSGDQQFMDSQGVEVLVETARMWADLGFWRSNGEAVFYIHGVTGPDEYTTVVNNNLFTNVMAKNNLEKAAEVVTELAERDPGAYRTLVERLDIDEGEIAEWRHCAEGMYIGWDENFGIHPQDDQFLDREVWDVANTPKDRFPLLLNFHPLVIYRFQVIKQADVVLALFLRGSEFTLEQKRADFEYYDPITTGDSTLSAVVQSIIAAEVGHQDLAMDYFMDGLFVDLANLHQNTSDGVHIASAGGVWNALVHGFGGLRSDSEQLEFDPRLPAAWPSLEFSLLVRGSRFEVRVTADEIAFTLLDGPEIEVDVRGQRVRVTADGVAVALDGHGPVLAPGELRTPSSVGDVRADGTVVSSTVPADPESPWEYPEGAPSDAEGEPDAHTS